MSPSHSTYWGGWSKRMPEARPQRGDSHERASNRTCPGACSRAFTRQRRCLRPDRSTSACCSRSGRHGADEGQEAGHDERSEGFDLQSVFGRGRQAGSARQASCKVPLELQEPWWPCGLIIEALPRTTRAGLAIGLLLARPGYRTRRPLRPWRKRSEAGQETRPPWCADLLTGTCAQGE